MGLRLRITLACLLFFYFACPSIFIIMFHCLVKSCSCISLPCHFIVSFSFLTPIFPHSFFLSTFCRATFLVCFPQTQVVSGIPLLMYHGCSFSFRISGSVLHCGSFTLFASYI